MPELPEVETTRRGLLPKMKGRTIMKVEVSNRSLRWPIPKDFEKRVAGKQVIDLRRRAKYLLFDLNSGDVVLSHLGMSGSFRVVSANRYRGKKHDHVLLHLDNHLVVAFHDPRRFGMMEAIKKSDEKEHKLLEGLGPEPLSKNFNAAYLERVLSKRNAPIKPVLMDQKIVVGVGNIYASESLFLAGIHPHTPANRVKALEPLVAAVQRTLESAIESGGSSLRDYMGAEGEAGYFQHHFQVYDRAGEDCFVCRKKITTEVMAGRSTYYCSTCQPHKKSSQKR